MTHEEYILYHGALNKPGACTTYDNKGMTIYKRNGKMIQTRAELDLCRKLEEAGRDVGVILTEFKPFGDFKVVKLGENVTYVCSPEELIELRKRMKKQQLGRILVPTHMCWSIGAVAFVDIRNDSKLRRAGFLASKPVYMACAPQFCVLVDIKSMSLSSSNGEQGYTRTAAKGGLSRARPVQ